MRPTTAVAPCPIDAYIAELDAVLRGPRRVRADLLAEARDGLTDAASAYAEAGYPLEEARRRAVADFGAVRTVAPAYRRELAAAQAPRTALWVLLVHAVVFVEGNLSWRVVDFWHGGGPGPVYMAFATVVDVAGYLITGALLAVLLGYRLLSRYVPVAWLVRGVGAFSLVALATMFAAGLGLTVATPLASASVLSMAVMVGAILGPAAVTGAAVGRGAYRCLRLAG